MRTHPAWLRISAVVAATAALAAAADARAAAAELRGRLVLTERGRPSRDPGVDLRQAAVWFVPDRAPARLAPIEVEMATVRKQFAPRLLVVPVGSTVRFPNQDPILHNVFSVSGGNDFDLGLVGAGSGKTATFRAPGIVQVFCNVHHAMFAHVVVVATPHYARPDETGAFTLAGLPAGAGTLHFWHERGEPGERRLKLPHGAPLALESAVTLPRVPRHKNKFGKSYRRGSYE
jgi:plastocyanin